jgi:zinc transport system substrate-binding protein
MSVFNLAGHRLITISLFVLILFTITFPQDKITVAVSILPQVEFLKNVGGDYIDILEMVPPNSSPETYEPTPTQMKQLARTKAYFKIGTDLDFEINLMGKMASINSHLIIIDCSKKIDLLTIHDPETTGESHSNHGHGLRDPHIWNSLKNARIMIDNIAKGLAAIDSIHSADYFKNAVAYMQKLDSLDTHVATILKNSPKQTFIVLHPAWGYFARDYNLNELSIEAEGKEPSAADIKNLINLAKAQNLRTVFASPQFNSESAKVVAREIGGSIDYIDPLDGQFLDNMYRTAEKIAASLK